MSRKKGINKSKVGFSINTEIIETFDKYCDEKSINKSKLINKLLEDFLKNEKII